MTKSTEVLDSVHAVRLLRAILASLAIFSLISLPTTNTVEAQQPPCTWTRTPLFRSRCVGPLSIFHDDNHGGSGGSYSGSGVSGYGNGRCPQWHDTAIAIGWPDNLWPTISRIMYAESACDPNAYNPRSGVAGLMQIHPLWWKAGDGGCTGNRYDPTNNLRCALWVYRSQGFDAWVTF